MRSSRRPALIFLAGVLLVSARARADIPAGYKGRPFDPAVAGGKGVIPADVKAGPYAVPGRLDLINYDLGGVGIAYDCIHHEVKGGDGYRTDTPTASLSLTSPSKMDVWYKAGATLEGTPYPTPTTKDFYVGALDATDWFNYTIDVQKAGTYALSTAWATGNGPPGGQGGDGSIGIQISVNGAKVVDWKASFPDFQTKANYHNWTPGPDFATVTLEAGLQVIKIQLTSNHLNLDYLDFALVGAADGGASPDAGGGASGSGGGTTGGAGTSGASGGGAGTTGAAGGGAGTTGASGTSGGAGTGGGGAGTTGGAGSSGAAGALTGGAGTSAPGAHASSGCALAGAPCPGDVSSLLVLALAVLVVRSSARRDRSRRA